MAKPNEAANPWANPSANPPANGREVNFAGRSRTGSGGRAKRAASEVSGSRGRLDAPAPELGELRMLASALIDLALSCLQEEREEKAA